MQKKEANAQFARFIDEEYAAWIEGDEDAPVLSHNVLKEKLFPALGKEPVFLVVIDNLRHDQWKVMQPLISEMFTIEKEETFYSILPTATQYARNALFSG